ncbi:integrase core domain-containing protein [Sorangium sp. So ce590]|uniref:integrase core domain-containing protein n=1 Tax=Sorangium sp. So ce590 TaxID=3133317 RepID=UPI003F5E2701
MPTPGKRRKFSAAEELRIVREAAACPQRGDIEPLLRREGIYGSLLTAWRKQPALHGSEALAGRKPGRKPKQDAKDRRIAELEKRLASTRTMYRLLAVSGESAQLAEQLFAETVARHGVEPGSLTVHADRGSAMRSEGLAQLLGSIGVGRTFSWPHVSDDNAFSEAQLKTLKYQPDHPERFASLTHARAWCQEFFGWYNDLHQHAGLALFTPADVFYGRVEGIAARRQVALDAAYAAHPERFPNGPPVVRRPPAAAAINPLSVDDAGEAAASTHTGTTSDAPEPGATPSAAARHQPLTSQSRSAPLNAIHA